MVVLLSSLNCAVLAAQGLAREAREEPRGAADGQAERMAQDQAAGWVKEGGNDEGFRCAREGGNAHDLPMTNDGTGSNGAALL